MKKSLISSGDLQKLPFSVVFWHILIRIWKLVVLISPLPPVKENGFRQDKNCLLLINIHHRRQCHSLDKDEMFFALFE